jgi:Flp pilus assembly protein TadD
MQAGALLALKRYEEAEAAYRAELDASPRDPALYYGLGIALWELGHYEDAERAQRNALALQPDSAEAHYELGNALNLQQRYEEAEASFERAIALRPKFAEAHTNLARVLLDLRRPEEAMARSRRALALTPAHWPSHAMLGNALRELGREREAETAFRRAIALAPKADVDMPRYNLGTLLLARGDFANGWPLYESRLEVKHGEWLRGMDPVPSFPFPRWEGDYASGKRLLVWPEQGFGDAITFARYVPLLADRGLRVTLACRAPLKELMRSLRGAEIADVGEAAARPFDFWTLICSLPSHVGGEGIPAAIPYLAADPQRVATWREHLPRGRFKVGLVWKGRADFRRDRYRSLPSFEVLRPLWEVPGVAFVSLQKGVDEDLQPPADQPLSRLGPAIADFADSAAIIAGLDLVITSDTAMAHLAGALGKKVWVLVPGYSRDWRWPATGETCRWYPGPMRLFHQGPDWAWEKTVAAVRDALQVLTR